MDVVLWVIDVAKANQTVRPLLPAIDRLTVTPDSAGEALDDVRRILIERGNWMAEHGLDEWEPDCGIPALIVWVEEGSALLGGMAVWKQLAQASLSLGVFLFDSMQRASAKDKDTGARAQIGNVLCFGVKSKADARFVLDDPQLIDRVASWRNRRQGSFVADVVGVDDLHRSMSVRTFWTGGREDTIGRIERDIRTNAPSMARPDDTIIRGSRPYSRPSTMDDPRTIPGRALDRPSSTVQLEPVDASSSVRRLAFGRAVEEAARPDPERGGQIIVRPRDVLRVMDEQNDWFDRGRHRPWVMGELKGACDRGILRRVEQGVYTVTGSD